MTTPEIELQLGFTYPALYKQLAEAGMLAAGQRGPDQPATLLAHCPGFELLSLEQASKLAADPADYRYIRADYQFIPFGQNESGDYYCFLLGERAGSDCPVVLLWGAFDEATFLAKNLQDFIFRQLLTALTGQHLDAQSSFAAFKQQMDSMLATHDCYLPEKQRALLHELLRRAPKSYQLTVTEYKEAPNIVGYETRDVGKTYRGFLTDEEVGPILAGTIAFDKLNACFTLGRG